MTETPISLALGLLMGTLFGLVHFASLRRVTEMFLTERSVKRALALHLVRMLLLVAVLYALAQLGAGPLIAGALGMILGREILLRRTRKAG